jgi:acyl-[acyl-carrier-protein]-phospholipid O-acyltransferase/long-chain-fatty-acid--[acyl-carrier-protein] ligase
MRHHARHQPAETGRTPQGTYRQVLGTTGLQPFLWTQFLGALNDNLYRIVVSLAAVAAAAGSGYLSLVGAIFIVPFFLFSGYAGQLADRYSKRTVLVATKVLEIVAMGLAVAALASGHLAALFAVLFLMALQSALFSPAKYGIVPEILGEKDLSRSNGLLEMTTFVAIILGTSIGGFMFAVWSDQPVVLGLALVAVAVAGTVTSLWIPRVAPANPDAPFQINPWREIASGTARLRRNRTLWLTVIGMSYFWFLGALLQMVIILLGTDVMRLSDQWVGALGAFLAIGIGVGSMAAGRLSGDKVELGLVPIGSIGMGASSFVLAGSETFASVSAALVLLGLSGGLFIVPLNALLQQKAGATERGQLMATNNFLNNAGVLLASGALWLLHDRLVFEPSQIVLLFGAVTLAANVYVLSILPDFLIRFSLWLLTHTIYRIRIEGQEHVPFRGPALLVCNHVSHIDGFLVGACVQRFIRFMVYRPYYEIRGIHWLMKKMNAIPVAAGRKDVAAALERARTELQRGHVVCIFAEGAISRTGNLLPFKRGFERIVEGLDVPVIPVHLDRVWGSIFSFQQGRFFWKWPARIPYPVTVTFGRPMPSSARAHEVRQAMLELGADSVGLRINPTDLLHRRFLRTARRRFFSFAMADSSGRELTYGKALAGTLALAGKIERRCPDEEMVGIMLPSSVGGALANVATLFAGKVPVNLNFTAGPEAMASAIEQCGIRTVLTSRVFLAKARLETPPGACFLEDVVKQIPRTRALWMWIVALVLPSHVLEGLFLTNARTADDLATVIFSSGSTGVPKGVMLSHRNILANVEGMGQVYWVTREDRILGVLPFFHSFGFTGCLWFPLVNGFGAVYHANPMDAGTIGGLVEKYQATIILSTPTFYMAYARKCTPGQFASLRLALAGAEKLREPVAHAFKAKYGLDLMEGYGCTEMAPAVSVNVPDCAPEGQTGTRFGTVGHPLPGVATKIVDVETGAPLPPGAEGLLLVRGANCMLGYLNQPDRTREVMRDGWYVTGDIAVIDEDGFIRITDRLARFSKIGGEMVPHGGLEECISSLINATASCVVTAVPDALRGERLVAFYTDAWMPPAQLWESLCRTDLPKLWLPKREDLRVVESIPTLGTGKVDLRAVRQLALDTL